MKTILKSMLVLVAMIAGGVVMPKVADACPSHALLMSQPKPPQVDFSIVKSGPETVKPGELAIYTITITNHGPHIAGATMYDSFPTELEYRSDKSSFPYHYRYCTYGSSRHQLECTTDWLGPSWETTATWKLAFKVAKDAKCGSMLENQASVSAVVDVNPGNNNTSFSTKIVCDEPGTTPTPEEPKDKNGALIVKKTDKGRETTRPGHSFYYELAVTNVGEVDLHDVNLVDTVPSQFKVLGVSNNGTVKGQSVAWNVATLQPGRTRTYSITVQTRKEAPDGHVCNIARAESRDQGLEDEDQDCITVEREKIKGVQVTPTPVPVRVPVTAKTGAGSVALVATLLGAAGVGLRKLVG